MSKQSFWTGLTWTGPDWNGLDLTGLASSLFLRSQGRSRRSRTFREWVKDDLDVQGRSRSVKDDLEGRGEVEPRMPTKQLTTRRRECDIQATVVGRRSLTHPTSKSPLMQRPLAMRPNLADVIRIT